jgi:hypothetical protein
MFGKEDLVLYGLFDASYKMDDQSISGILIMLGNKTNEKAVLLYWKSKTIVQV